MSIKKNSKNLSNAQYSIRAMIIKLQKLSDTSS